MISKEQIAALVTLYSQFHGAIDPFSPEVVAAEVFINCFIPCIPRTLPTYPFPNSADMLFGNANCISARIDPPLGNFAAA